MRKKTVSLLLAGVMLLGTSVTAMANPAQNQPAEGERELPGQGYIAREKEYSDNDEEGNGGDTDGMVDVSIPANGFFWYVNEDTAVDTNGLVRADDKVNEYANFIAGAPTHFEVRSAKYEITNNSDILNLQVKLADYKKASFTGARDTITASKVDLQLAGDLYVANVTEDLLNTALPTEGVTYSNLFKKGETWEYSFTGTYNDTTLPTTAELTDYVMVLEFEVIGADTGI